ncbi:unnamed protein product [Malus baccata var. baccata]
MALTSRFLFATSSSMLLFSLVAIASATDYSSGAPKPKVDEHPKLPKVDMPKLPNVGKPKPEVYTKLKPQTIDIQGLVLCRSGLQSLPIKGAVVRITCLAEDKQGYETAPFSILSGATDAKGYFISTLSPSQLGDKWKLTECKAFLDYSPLETCKVPTDVNQGITGHLLSSYRTLSAKNIKLYSVGPFFCSSKPKPVPNVLVLVAVTASAAGAGSYGNTNPDQYEKPKPKKQNNLLSTNAILGIQGLVYSAARITCEAVDQYGLETSPVTILGDATDAKGYFFATICPSEIENKKQLTKCKAFLELSSSETCNIPTDSNSGISGAVLASYRLLHDKNIKLYTVGPLLSHHHHKPRVQSLIITLV